MAGKRMEYLFKLNDKMSGPANSILKKLIALDDKLKKLAGMGKTFESIASKMGGVSTRSKGAASSLGLFGSKSKGAASSFELLSTKMSGLTLTINPLEMALGVLGGIGSAIGSIVSGITSAAAGMADLYYQTSKFALQTAAASESHRVTLGVLLGSEDAARKLATWELDFARKTPFELKEVQQMTQSLLGAGFKFNPDKAGVSELSVVSKILGDMASIDLSKKTETIQGLTKALRQIRGYGKLRTNELNQLFEWGVSQDSLFDAIALRKGVGKDQVQSLIEKRKITWEDTIDAMADVSKSRFTGLGGLMEKQSKTLMGLWSTLESAPADLLANLDMGGGFQRAKKFFGNLVDALDPSKESGKKVQARLERFFDRVFTDVFGGLSGKDGPDKMANMFISVIDTGEKLWGSFVKIGGEVSKFFASFDKKNQDPLIGFGVALSRVGTVIVGIGKGISWVISKIITLVRTVVAAHPAFQLLGKTFEINEKIQAQVDAAAGSQQPLFSDDFLLPQRAFSRMGFSLTEGLVEGIQQGRWMVSNAVTDLFHNHVEAPYRKASQTHSPSRVFEMLGRYATDGYALGLEAGGAEVESAAKLSLLAKPTQSLSAFSANTNTSHGPRVMLGGMGGVNIHINTAPGTSPQEVAEEVRRVLPEAVAEAFERLGLEAGTPDSTN